MPIARCLGTFGSYTFQENNIFFEMIAFNANLKLHDCHPPICDCSNDAVNDTNSVHLPWCGEGFYTEETG